MKRTRSTDEQSVGVLHEASVSTIVASGRFLGRQSYKRKYLAIECLPPSTD